MPTVRTAAMTELDQRLSRDPVLAKLSSLFPESVTGTELTERPQAPARRRRLPRLRKLAHSPEFLMLSAAAELVICAILGGIFNSGTIALCGLAAPILLGIGCYLAVRTPRVSAQGPRLGHMG
jgi:hypothetical protein